MRQVIGPDSRRLCACVQVHQDVHLPCTHVDQRSVLAYFPRTAHLNAVDAHVQHGWIKGGSGGAHRRQDTAPVRVAAEDGTLEQIVAGDRARDLKGVGDTYRAADLYLNIMVGALGIGDELSGEICSYRGDRSGHQAA